MQKNTVYKNETLDVLINMNEKVTKLIWETVKKFVLKQANIMDDSSTEDRDQNVLSSKYYL